jgi:hypothetical protein
MQGLGPVVSFDCFMTRRLKHHGQLASSGASVLATSAIIDELAIRNNNNSCFINVAINYQ